MNNTDDNKNNDNYETVHLSRYVLVINTILSLVVFAVLSLSYYETDFSQFLMWFIVVLAGGISLLTATLRRKRRSDLNRLLLPWFVLGIIFLIYNLQVQRLKGDLTNAKITAAGYRDMVERDVTLPFKGGHPWLTHQFLLAAPKVERVRILGINALGVLHTHRLNLERIIDKDEDKGFVQILLLKGALPGQDASQAFQARVAEEEGKIDGREGRIANRIQAEWEASIAILADIFNRLRKKHKMTYLQKRFQIKFHKEYPDRSVLFVDREEKYQETGKSKHRKYLLLNYYSKNPKEFGQNSLSLLVDSSWTEYIDEEKEFKRLWDSAESFALENLEDMLDSIDPAQAQYSRALLYHEQRRLDEASYLYREVLERYKPESPTQEQKQLAKRFLPRLYTTEKEPFKLKDLVVVIHPSERLIGYHLVWEDDIDFLIDNDPGDHEIVWIKYDEAQERVELVWAYWHGKFLQTTEAVEDANNHDSRVAIYVQWGKHGSLLKGWGDIIAVDSDKKERYEPLQYSRLSSDDGTRLARGNERAIGFHAEQFPDLFDGTVEEFKTFPKEVDLQEHLRKKEMIVVSKYANAVIDQWFLPYNIYPKPDWPRD